MGTEEQDNGMGARAGEDDQELSPARYYFEEGSRAAREGRLDEARAFYGRSLKEETLPETLFQLGVLDIHEHRLDSALETLTALTQLVPSSAVAFLHVGAVWMLKGDYQRAKGFIEQSLNLDPTYAMAHFNLGVVQLELNQPREALESFHCVAGLNPHYPGLADVLAEAQRAAGEG